MPTIQEAIKSVQDYGDNFTKALERHRGFLGNGEGTVYVADRDGYVYVRNRQAESTAITGTMEPEEVIYARSDIPPIEDYPVIYGRDIDTEDFQLLATDSKQLLGWIFDKYIKDHHEQHEFNEYDTVWIQKQAMLPLLVYPTSPVSTTVSAFGGWYQWDTDWHYFETTTSSELSSYIPTTSGKARFLLICIDGETETLYYESGDTFIIFLPPRDSEDRIPPPPEGKIPLAAIYLPYGTTSFDWDILYDVRLLFSGGGSMSTGSAPRDASYVTLGLDAILSAERVLTAAAGITLLDSGAGGIVAVGLDDHDHSGDVGDGGIIPGTSVELPEIPVATYDDVTDWFNTTQSAGRLSGGAITDNGDGTIDVAAGTGYIKVADDNLANTLFFDWPATAAPLTPTDDAKNWVYIDYSGGTPVVGITDDENTISRNDMFYVARLWRDGNDLHIVNHGQSAYNLSMRTDRYLADVFHNIRSSGQVTAEKNERYLTVTAGIMFHGLSLFETAAVDTSLTGAGDIFTFYYRDGAAGWTTGTASQIDNVNYDDGTGALEPVTVKQYGVFWVYLCHESRLYVQYGQASYKLAAAQESQVPVPPPFLAGFANLIARVIVQRNAANLEEIAYPWDEVFMPQAATDHNQLGNLQGGAVDEYYHLDQTAYAELSGGLGGLLHNDLGGLQGGQADEYYHFTQAQHTSFTVVGEVGSVLVSTGVNVWGADLTPLWMGSHTWGSGFNVMPTDATGQDLGDATHRWDLHTQDVHFEGATGDNSITIPDGLVDAFNIVDTGANVHLQIDTDNNYFLIDPATAGVFVGIGTAAPGTMLELSSATSSDITLTNTGNDNVVTYWDAAVIAADAFIGVIVGQWNGNNVAYIAIETGDDTVNEDDGEISFWTSPTGSVPAERMRIDNIGYIGMGIIDPGNAHLYVYDLTLDSVATFYGIRGVHVKTAGAGGAGDDYYGIHSYMELNQATTIDNLYGGYAIGLLTLGTADIIYGSWLEAQVDGGTVNVDVIGLRSQVDINAGTIDGTVKGLAVHVDIEAAATCNDLIYGLYVWMDDLDDTSASIMIYLDEQNNIDWGIFHVGPSPSYIGGQVEIDQTDPTGVIPVLVLDQGDADQPFIQFQNGTIYTGKSGVDEYIKVQTPGPLTRYIKLYQD